MTFLGLLGHVIALSHDDSMTLLSVLRSTAKELNRNLKVEYHLPAKQQRKKPGGIKGSGEWPKHEGAEGMKVTDWRKQGIRT